MVGTIGKYLAEKNAADLLSHECKTIPKETLHLPSPTFIDDVYAITDRNQRVLHNLSCLFDTGCLAGTGYMSILPVDKAHDMGAAAVGATIYFGSEEASHPAFFCQAMDRRPPADRES